MRTVVLMTLAACLLMAGAAFAADENAAPAVKIGVVDMQTVATPREPAQAAKKKAEDLKNPKASEEKKLAFIRAKQELDQKTRNFLRKVEQDEVKLRQDMVTLVFSATYEVARAKGFNFVVDVTAGGVLYADQSMDLTQDVLAEVNKLYKAGGAKKDTKKDAKK